MKFFRRHLWAVLYSSLLVAFTVYISLDTFVISRVYAEAPQTDVSYENAEGEAETDAAEAEESGEAEETSRESDSSSGRKKHEKKSSVSEEEETDIGATVTESSYSDGGISITLTEYREYDTAIYVADVALSSAEYLKTAFAQNAYGRNVTAVTSEIAKDAGAILAINGDYYGARQQGYVIRNGVLYRETVASNQEDLVIYENGTFGIISEEDVTAQELLENGAVQVLSFGPALVVDGEISVSEGDEVGKAKASNPRTAIGVIDALHYVFVVSDGRTEESEGLSLSELAEFMEGLGVQTAYNLDGGGSSTLYFNGEVINQPTTNGKKIGERSVSDIVCIGY